MHQVLFLIIIFNIKMFKWISCLFCMVVGLEEERLEPGNSFLGNYNLTIKHSSPGFVKNSM